MNEKILIFIITYKASFRLINVFRKIPINFFGNKNLKILISDDDSEDDTLEYINLIKEKYKSNVIVNLNKKNIGYGANIKKCIKYAYKNKFKYAVMIHGDAQYDSKYSAKMINYLIKNKDLAAAVGSRMMNKTKALKGNMPVYKFLGNIFLTKLFNFCHNTDFTDCHTGYWAYNLNKIEKKTFNKLDDKFCFDIDLRIELVNRNLRIKEIPIETLYGTERSSTHIIYALRFFFKTLKNFLYK